MRVLLSDVRRAFDDLIGGGRSREEIAAWADSALRADDDEQLELEPEEARDTIWDAITYLTGVDMKTSPATYLHSVEDFVAYRETLGV